MGMWTSVNDDNIILTEEEIELFKWSLDQVHPIGDILDPSQKLKDLMKKIGVRT